MGTTQERKRDVIDMHVDSDEQGNAVAVSRRSFVELAVGAITMLPAVSGGFALTIAPGQAHAADSVSPETKIVIAKPNETGFAVADVSGNKRVPVAGAKITLTSNENNKSISGTTGSDGLWVADLSKIAAAAKDANGVDAYSAQVAITLEKDGYRSFETGWMSIKGGAGYDLPTRQLGDAIAYPKRVTLSDWDVLYTNNEFALTPANDETHEISIVFCSKVQKELTATLFAIGKNRKVATAKAEATGRNKDFYFIKITMKGAFLMTGDINALIPNEQYRIDYSIDGKNYSVPLRLKITEAPSALTAPFAKKMSFAPFGDAGMDLSVRMPEFVPLFGGQKIKLWKPDLPIDICYDPYGYFRASLRTSEWGFKSKNGKVDGVTTGADGKKQGSAWKTLPRKSFEEQYNETKKELGNHAMKTGATMANSSRSTFTALEASTALKMAFSAEGAIAGRWSATSNAFRAKAEIRGILSIVYSYAQQLFAGPVPIVVQFDLNVNASIGVGCGIVMPQMQKASDGFSAWEYDFPSTGVNFTLRIAPALSAGVGIKGVASVSLQGIVAFTVFVGAGPLPKGGKEKNPHAIVGLTATVNVVVQLMFFTVPVKIWEFDRPKLYDNWDPDKLYAQSDSMAALSAQADEDWLDDVVAMDLEDDLAEQEGDGIIETPALSMQSEDLSASTLQYEMRTERFSTNDGLTYGISTFGIANGEAWQNGAAVVASDEREGALMAGSSPSLAAQSTTQDAPLIAQADTASVGDYKDYGSHEYKGEVITNAEGYMKLGLNSGIVPGKRQRIAKNVISDPRVKIVSVFGETIMFRIAAVKVKDKVRTRIVGQRLQTAKKPAGPICVFDFQPYITKEKKGNYSPENLVDRNELWDYDFDVCVLTHRKHQRSIHFFLISGKRESGANLGQVASDVVFQHARFDVEFVDDKWKIVDRSAHGVMAKNFTFDFASSGAWYHNFSCPQMQWAEDNNINKKAWQDGSEPHGELLFTFLARSAQSPDKVMSSKPEDGVRVSIGLCSATGQASEFDSYYRFLLFDLSNLTSDLNDPTIFEMTCSKRFRKNYHCGWNIVSLRGAKNVYHYSLLTTTFHEDASKSPKNQRTRVLEAKLWKVCSADGFLDDKPDIDLLRLVDWPNHGETFLASIDGKLQSVTFGNGSLTPTYAEVGPSNFAINSFGLDPSGTILYYPTVSEGVPGYKYSTSDGASDVQSTPMPKVNSNRIMACRMRNGKFSDPFVFAEVEYDMDNLAIVNVSSDSIGFVSTDVVNAQKGQADLYYTALPFVKCANIIGCEAVTTFAYPGMDAVFDLTVRNDGNTYISGFTAQIMEKGGTPQGSKKVVFSKSSLQESNFNPSENGKLKDVEDDYALAPGKTSVYRVSLPIPKSWSGKKSVCVKATDVVVAPVKVSPGLRIQEDMGETGLINADDPSQSEAPQEYEIVYDGDQGETFGYDDSDAYEYVVGDHEGDYDGEDGEPYDLLDMDGESRFYDEDDYDDADEDDEDDYDLSLGDVLIEGDEGESDDADGAGAAVTRPSSTAASKIAKTGDAAGPLTGLLGVAAVAGAAMAAYSARRVANERSESEED